MWVYCGLRSSCSGAAAAWRYNVIDCPVNSFRQSKRIGRSPLALPLWEENRLCLIFATSDSRTFGSTPLFELSGNKA